MPTKHHINATMLTNQCCTSKLSLRVLLQRDSALRQFLRGESLLLQMQTPDLRKFLEKHGTGDDVFPEPERFQKPVTAEGNPPASNPQAAAKDAKEAECLRRIRTIGAAASLYSQDYDGTLPRTIDQLIGNYLPEHPTTRAELISPFASDNKTPSYEFVTPGAKLPDLKPDSIIIRSLFMAPGNRRSIYRANGTAEMIQDK